MKREDLGMILKLSRNLLMAKRMIPELVNLGIGITRHIGENMKILVTGGLGFIGSNFIRYMISQCRDVKIINVDKIGTGANPESLRDINGLRNYQFVRGDISNMHLISKLIKKIDAVVNFAAETHVDRSIVKPHTFIKSNILGTFTLLEALRKDIGRGYSLLYPSKNKKGIYDKKWQIIVNVPLEEILGWKRI